jgi:DNA-binding beta-propeller fold protein YncE
MCLGVNRLEGQIQDEPNVKPFLSAALMVMVIGSVLICACGGSGIPIANTRVPSIAGQNASFDNVEIDQVAHRLYATDRTNRGVDVFDISKAKARYLKTIAMGSAPNGLALAPDIGHLFVGTASGTVTVVDTSTEAIVDQVVTGGSGADLVDYAASRQRLYVSNASDGTITSIDSTTDKVKARFVIGSYQLEQPRFNPGDGMVYVTSPTADSLFRVDPNDGLTKHIFSLNGCQPLGLAINPTSEAALMVCKTFVMSLDLTTGKSQKFSQVLGGDVVNYDAKVDQFFVGSPHITKPSVVGIFGGTPIAYYSSVSTDAHGNSATYDETNNIVYTPNLLPNKAGVSSFTLPDRPQMLPPWLSTLTTFGFYGALIVGLGLLVLFISRSADPARRPLPKVKPVKSEPAPAASSATNERSPRGSKAETAT